MREGWKILPLGELGRIELGKTPSRGNPRLWDQDRKTANVWLSIADLPQRGKPIVNDSKEYVSDEGAKNCKVVKNGTLLVSFKLTLGRLAFAGRDLYTNEAIAAITILDKLRLMKDYLYWYLTFFDWHKAAEGDHKIKGKTLNKAKLKVIDVLVPPLPEQKRIVAILDEAFEGLGRAVANAEKNLANARELFESYLNAVFTQKGEGWMETTLGEIADHCLGKMLDKKKNRGSPKPYLRNLNVRWFDFDLTDLLEMRFEEGEKDRYSAKKGDVLICEGGYPGRAAIWPYDNPIFFQKAIHRVRFREPMQNKWFLYSIYLADAKDQLRQYFTGTGIQHFTGQSLKRYRLPIAPIVEIERHIEQFDELFSETQHLEVIYQQKLTALAELKQSLLQKAFTGELTAEDTNIKEEAVA